MASDFVAANGISVPERISGVVTRIAVLHAGSAKEFFHVREDLTFDPVLTLNGFPDGARFVDVRLFEDEPGWDPALVYMRPVPGSDAESFDPVAYFAGNRATAATPDPVRNLWDVEPMGEEEFWAALAVLEGRATEEGAQRLAHQLAALPVRGIEAFWRRLMDTLAALRTEEVAARAGRDVLFGSDAFLWWRLAVVARGRDAVEVVVSGGSVSTDEDEEEAAGCLEVVAEDAVELREGERPVFISEAPKGKGGAKRLSKAAEVEAMMRAKYGDGTADLRPGPRTLAAMFERDLILTLVTSRFLVRAAGLVYECLVTQHIDPYAENVAKHVRAGAAGVAERLGGEIVTPIEHDELGTLSLQGFPIFEIRRPWKGTLADYCANYGFHIPEPDGE